MPETMQMSAVLTVTEVSIGLAVLFGLATIWFGFRNRPRLKLVYYYPVRRRILSKSWLEDDIMLGDVPVRELYLVQLHVRNAGNRTLRGTDFLVPPSLEVDCSNIGKFQPLSVSRTKADVPITFSVSRTEDTCVVHLDSELIEPGDRIVFQFLYESNGPQEYDFQCRIVNGKTQYRHVYESLTGEDIEYGIHRRYHRQRRVAFSLFVLGYTGCLMLLMMVQSSLPYLRDLSDTSLERLFLVLAFLSPWIAHKTARLTTDDWLRRKEDSDIEKYQAKLGRLEQ